MMHVSIQIGSMALAVINILAVIFYAGRLVEEVRGIKEKLDSFEQRILTLERSSLRAAEARAKLG